MPASERLTLRELAQSGTVDLKIDGTARNLVGHWWTLEFHLAQE
jgi:hypothetical protein